MTSLGFPDGFFSRHLPARQNNFLSCSGSWVKGWCASVVKTPTLGLLVVVTYGLVDKLQNFVIEIFIPQYHYPYAVALSFAQVLISLLVLNLLHVVDLVPLKHYSRSLGERVLVPAICSSTHAVLAMWAKTNSSYTGLFPLTLPLLPMLTVSFSFVLKLASPPSINVSVLISILSGMSLVITASKASSDVDPLEYIYAPLALVLHSLSLTWLAKEAELCYSPNAHISIFDIYYTQLVNQSWVLGLLWLLHPDSPWQVLSQGSWHSLLFHGYLLAILLLGMVLNFLVGMLALCVSPLAAALLYSAKQLVQPFFPLL